MFRFSIRDLFWLILLAAVASFAYRDRQTSQARIAAIKAEADAEKASLRQSQASLRESQETLDNKIASQAILQKLTLTSQQLDAVREYSAKCVVTERIDNEYKQHHLLIQIRRPLSASSLLRSSPPRPSPSKPSPNVKTKQPGDRMARLTFLDAHGNETLELTAQGTVPSNQWTFKHLAIPPAGSSEQRLDDDLRNAVAWGVGIDEILKRFRDRYTKEITLPGVRISTYDVIPDDKTDKSPAWEKFTHVYCEITHTEKHPRFDCYSARLVIDQKTLVPIQLAEFDWPKNPIDNSPPLIWSLELSDVNLNAGSPTSAFE